MLVYIAFSAFICYNTPMLNQILCNNIQFLHNFTQNNEKSHFTSHHHTDCEILCIVKGSGTFLIEDVSYEFTENTIFFIPPGKYHVLKTPPHENYERYVVSFPHELIPQCIAQLHGFCKKADPAVLDLFRKFDSYTKIYPAEPLHTLLLSFLSELLIILAYDTQNSDYSPLEMPQLVTGAIAFIAENLDTPLSTKDIAAHLFVSPSYLQHVFTKTMHISIMQFVRLKKMYTAREYLLRGFQPVQVASLMNFNDYPTFYKSFRSVFHISPSSVGKTK